MLDAQFGHRFHCEGDHWLRREGSFVLWRLRSWHQWLRYRFGAFLQDRLFDKGWWAGLECSRIFQQERVVLYQWGHLSRWRPDLTFLRRWAFTWFVRWTRNGYRGYRFRMFLRRSEFRKIFTWTTALLPAISSTCPFLTEPSPRHTLTISAYLGNLTLSKMTSGPSTLTTVL